MWIYNIAVGVFGIFGIYDGLSRGESSWTLRDIIGIEIWESILIGGINQEQYFLLIPPNLTNEKWKYWKFANWHPGEEEHLNLESYFTEVLNFMT